MVSRFLAVSFILCIFAISLLTVGSDGEVVLSRQKKALVFPQFTTFQLAMCFISQISYIPSHKVAVNTGFTIAYGLPYNSSNFWSPVYWARALMTSNSSSSVLSNYFQKLIQSGNDFSLQSEDNQSETGQVTTSDDETTVAYEEDDTTTVIATTEKTKQSKNKNKPITKRDVTASEFYSGVKKILGFSGYHNDCLLKSVCELAKRPLSESTEDSLIYDIVHFILSPSVHNGFDGENEQEEQKLFEAAEELGKSGGDCNLMYESCTTSPLHSISNFIDAEIAE